MRGKLSFRFLPNLRARITPAHAGKTIKEASLNPPSTDHPRACGENICTRLRPGSGTGSPPRMRGKPQWSSHTNSQARITPAHAGKTLSRSSRSLRLADHPRACGENSMQDSADATLNGSPPRMRGKQLNQCRHHKSNRITPAHAGKTEGKSRIWRRLSDHPRACGENVPQYLRIHVGVGSPPRMRGKREVD